MYGLLRITDKQKKLVKVFKSNKDKKNHTNFRNLNYVVYLRQNQGFNQHYNIR